MAERALKQDDASDDAFPPTAERFRAARARLGISEAEVAGRWRHQPSLYWDLELYNSEVFTCVDVRDLPLLARALDTPLVQLLFGTEPPMLPSVPYSEVVRGIRDHASAAGLTLQQFSDVVGWDIEALMQDPSAIGKYNLQGLYDICSAVGIDWIGVLKQAEQESSSGRAEDARR